MNVSSVVVRTKPEDLREVMDSLRASALCDVYFHDEKGRVVVTIEGRSHEEEMKKMKALMQIPKVLSADLMYAYSEDELPEALEQLKGDADSVPDVLKDET
jgi:nitrate reductase NapD